MVSKTRLLLVVPMLALILGSFLVTQESLAQNSTIESNQSAELLKQIESLLQQLQVLQSQLAKQKTQKSYSTKLVLTEGMSGEEISRVQKALAADRSLYPEGLVTGYYGTMTKEAVRRLQKRHNLPVTGMLDEATKTRLYGIGVPTAPTLPVPIACTMDAFQCPDGSLVSRTGPKCEFICPKPTALPLPLPPVMCPMDAKICPNGSSVVRTGPKCEFKPCPISEPTPVNCPMDKFRCTDGSMVGTSGPNCEYVCPGLNPTM